jgi:hypothetical protein
VIQDNLEIGSGLLSLSNLLLGFWGKTNDKDSGQVFKAAPDSHLEPMTLVQMVHVYLHRSILQVTVDEVMTRYRRKCISSQMGVCSKKKSFWSVCFSRVVGTVLLYSHFGATWV